MCHEGTEIEAFAAQTRSRVSSVTGYGWFLGLPPHLPLVRIQNLHGSNPSLSLPSRHLMTRPGPTHFVVRSAAVNVVGRLAVRPAASSSSVAAGSCPSSARPLVASRLRSGQASSASLRQGPADQTLECNAIGTLCPGSSLGGLAVSRTLWLPVGKMEAWTPCCRARSVPVSSGLKIAPALLSTLL